MTKLADSFTTRRQPKTDLLDSISWIRLSDHRNWKLKISDNLLLLLLPKEDLDFATSTIHDPSFYEDDADWCHFTVSGNPFLFNFRLIPERDKNGISVKPELKGSVLCKDY